MANEEHLERIKDSVETWNSWRHQNPEIQPNLWAADLSKANLCSADLRWTNLNYANLRAVKLQEADLSGAILIEANLSGAHLHSANLSEADLTNADLTWSQLTAVNLSDANLIDANLSNANLIGADFRGVYMWRTNFGDNDLSAVRGLEAVQHVGPSMLGINTLFRSDGKIPLVFLRGVGLSEGFVTYLPSLIERPMEFYSCFISYSHADQSFARRLHDALQGRGIRCWLDEHELLPGDKIYAEVDRGIRLWDKVLLCCSKDALTSWWVDNEIKIAFDKEQQLWKRRGKEVLSLIPLNLDDYLFSGNWKSGLATEVKARLAANFTGWEHDNKTFEGQFERVVRALRTTGEKGPPPPSLL